MSSSWYSGIWRRQHSQKLKLQIGPICNYAKLLRYFQINQLILPNIFCELPTNAKNCLILLHWLGTWLLPFADSNHKFCSRISRRQKIIRGIAFWIFTNIDLRSLSIRRIFMTKLRTSFANLTMYSPYLRFYKCVNFVWLARI